MKQWRKAKQNKPARQEAEALAIPKENKSTHAILIALIFLPCLILTLHLDNDLWFLLNSGRYVLQHGIPAMEPFSMHQGFHFVMQQWLSATIFWSIYAKCGAIGILALVFVVYFATVFVLYKLISLLAGGNEIATFVTAMIASAALKPAMISRPMIFTMLILVCELYCTEQFIHTKKPLWLLPLPILSVLQINLHAAMWPMQFIILLPYCVDAFRFRFHVLEGEGYPKRFFFPALGLMFLAGFLNPYGWSAMSYVFRSYGYQEIGMVQEMQPVDINQVSGMLIFGLFALLLAFYLFKKERKTRLRYVLLSLGTAVLTLSSLRSYSLFAACGIFPLAYLLRDVSLPKSKIQTQKGVLRLRAVLMALVAVVVGVLVISRVSEFDEQKETPKAAKAVDYLLEHENTEDMILYTGYNDGGYVEYRGLKPYIDPRAEVFVKKNNQVKDVMKEYYELEAGKTYYKDFLNTYGFTHLLLTRKEVLYVALPHDPDYELIYEDDAFLIYRLQ